MISIGEFFPHPILFSFSGLVSFFINLTNQVVFHWEGCYSSHHLPPKAKSPPIVEPCTFVTIEMSA